MKKALFLFLLAGCAAEPPILKSVPVDMPVLASCAGGAVREPAFALAHVSARDSLFDKVKAALVELDQRKAYEAELRSQNAACS